MSLDYTSLTQFFDDTPISNVDRGYMYLKHGGKKSFSPKLLCEQLDLQSKLEGDPALMPFLLEYFKNKKAFESSVFEAYSKYCEVGEFAPQKEELEPADLQGLYSMSDTYKRIERHKSLKPIINDSNIFPDLIFIIDPSDGDSVVRDIRFENYYRDTGLSEEIILDNIKIPRVKVLYAPDKCSASYREVDDRGVEHVYYNLHTAPYWRNMEVSAAYPEKIRQFLEHLFPVESDREQVLDHLHHMVVRRCALALVLVGFKKVGKTIFTSRLIKALVGPKNFNQTNESTLKEKFNSALKNYRVVFFDEVPIDTPSAIAAIKNYTNDTIAIEEKGRDIYQVQNHASLVFATNRKTEVKVSTSDRRFSIPRVATAPLKSLWSTREIAEFIDELERYDSEMVASFGKWLIERKPATWFDEPIKGQYYLDICRLGMNIWQDFVLTTLLETEEHISYGELKKAFKAANRDHAKYFPQAKTISDFIEENPIEDGIFIAREVRVPNARNGPQAVFFLTDEYKKLRESRGGFTWDKPENRPEIGPEEEEEELEFIVEPGREEDLL